MTMENIQDTENKKGKNRNKLMGIKMRLFRKYIKKESMTQKEFLRETGLCSVSALSNMEKHGISHNKINSYIETLEDYLKRIKNTPIENGILIERYNTEMVRTLFLNQDLEEKEEIIGFIKASGNAERARILEKHRKSGVIKRYQKVLEEVLENQLAMINPISLQVNDRQEEGKLGIHTLRDNNHIILEGKAGSGKSTSFKKMVLDILNTNENIIPILIDISRKRHILNENPPGDLTGLLGTLLLPVFSELGLNGIEGTQNDVHKFINNLVAGRENLLIMFDGYDELSGDAKDGERFQLLQLVNKLAKESKKEKLKNKVWISTRPLPFSEFEELNIRFLTLKIQPLDNRQKTEILEKEHQHSRLDVTPEVFLNDLAINPAMYELSRNPLMLGFLVKLPRQSRSERKSRTDVLSWVVNYHLKNRKPDSIKEEFPDHESGFIDKLEVLSQLAFDLTFTYKNNPHFEEQKFEQSLGKHSNPKLKKISPSKILQELIETGLIEAGAGRERFYILNAIKDYLTANYLCSQINHLNPPVIQDCSGRREDELISQMVESPDTVSHYLDILVFLCGCHDQPWFIETMIDKSCKPMNILECLVEIHDATKSNLTGSSGLNKMLENKAFEKKIQTFFANIEMRKFYPYIMRLAPELIEIFTTVFKKRRNRRAGSKADDILVKHLERNNRWSLHSYGQFSLENQKHFLEKLASESTGEASKTKKLKRLYRELFDFVGIYYSAYTSATKSVYKHAQPNMFYYETVDDDPDLTEFEKGFISKYLSQEHLQQIIDFTSLDNWTNTYDVKGDFSKFLRASLDGLEEYKEEDYLELYDWLSCSEKLLFKGTYFIQQAIHDKPKQRNNNLIVLLPTLNVDPARLDEDQTGSCFKKEDLVQGILDFLLDESNRSIKIHICVIGNGKDEQNLVASHYFGMPSKLGNHEAYFLYVWLVFLYKVLHAGYSIKKTLDLLARFLDNITFESVSKNTIDGFYLTLLQLAEKGLFKLGSANTFIICRPVYLARRSFLEMEVCIDQIKKTNPKNQTEGLSTSDFYFPESDTFLIRKESIPELYNDKYNGRSFPDGRLKLAQNLVHEMIRIIHGLKFQKPYLKQPTKVKHV